MMNKLSTVNILLLASIVCFTNFAGAQISPEPTPILVPTLPPTIPTIPPLPTIPIYPTIPPTGDNTITNITLDPSSPASLELGEEVTVNFDYSTVASGGVRIYVRPYTNGESTPNYAAHGSPLYETGSGSGDGFFTITDMPARVDQLKFEMTNDGQTETLLEFYMPVEYTFGVIPDPIWVDDDNDSGIEDGTEEHPYRTISAAMNVAVTHTVRVRSGFYPETVTLKDGVKLIGDGFETTTIDGGGSGTLITCTDAGASTWISGFRLQNAERGIYCSNASPRIQENYITDMDVDSTAADGIALSNSSPLIQFNVIYNVGGMGINGQGNSEPEIINNTIYDYRYYAGIGFAALNIGAVSPVVKNNIVVRGNSEPVGGILWSAPASVQVSFNNVYDPQDVTGTGSYYAVSENSTWTEVNGGPGAISEDPMFVDAANGNFRLQEDSPCIDAGDPASQYNDVDGSRNDIGAFGGLHIEGGNVFHKGSGFLFTSVGQIPITGINQDSTDSSYGLADVSSATSSQYSIPQYTDSPFGGRLWIRGLFGASDDVDYYKIIATSLDSGDSFDLNDSLTKTLYTIQSDGSVKRERIQLGPLNMDGIENLYELNKSGYWSQQDLRIIWNTTGLNGQYRLSVKGYQEVSAGDIEEVTLPVNDLSQVTLWIDNYDVDVEIINVAYGNGDELVECEDILFPHAGTSQLQFQIKAHHPGGFLDYFILDAWWGHNNSGGRFTREQYVGQNDGSPPMWAGYMDQTLPSLVPVDSNGTPVPWEDCAYRFRIKARARTTNGFRYIKRDTFNVYHSVETSVSAKVAARIVADCVDCPENIDTNPANAIILPRIEAIETSGDLQRTETQVSARVRPRSVVPLALFTIDDFTDNWVNVNPDTLGVTRLNIQAQNGNVAVHGYGQCTPTDCDWGTVTAPFTGNPTTVMFDFGFATDTLTMELIGQNTLRVVDFTDYSEEDGRTDSEATYEFTRGTVWVDDDNTSGTEDGTRQNPFNTIGEGITAAVEHQIVRVLSGRYTEEVDMKDGVDLIGSGEESTFIDPGTTGRAVDFVGLGEGEVLAGFTIMNAGVGVYCHTSSPVIRENYITNIEIGSTSGDGIRLDDSSPQIMHNVIYHVGGMGIRGQGNSEPNIINNTIYDYRYYAGISFSALNIGPVTPLVMNNIVVRGNEQPVGGISWSSPASIMVSYNNVYDPAGTGSGGLAAYSYHDGTQWNVMSGGDGAISADPMFVDEANGYFRLDSDSPCIDAGNPDPQYNDNDGTRNDMGAYGGGRLETSAPSRTQSGFVFTSIGKVPLTEIVDDPSDPSHGLLQVSDTVKNDLHIPKYTDAAFGGNLWIRGLFGESDDVDYYQILAAPYGTSATETLDDPLSKTHFTIEEDGSVNKTNVRMGPLTVGGVQNVYRLNKDGYWSFTDLRYIWRTSGLNGKYSVAIQPYRESGGTLQPVNLPSNELDHFTIVINNKSVEMQIHSIKYADGTPLAECEKINLPHNGDSRLIFEITAAHPDGFLRNFRLNSQWGNNRYGGEFISEQYVGLHDSSPPSWTGLTEVELIPLLPRDSDGNVMDWNTCPYRFHLSGWGRITDGVSYIKRDSDNVYQSIVTGTAPSTPTPQPTVEPILTPLPIVTPPIIPPTLAPTTMPTSTPTSTPTPTPQVEPTVPEEEQEVFIFDDPKDTSGDLTGQTDFDPIDERNLTIAWEADHTNAKDWHIYVREGFGGMLFLGRVGNGEASSFAWQPGAENLAAGFKNGPDFNTVYRFRVVRIDDQVTPDDYYDLPRPVGFNVEGGNPVPLVQPAMPDLFARNVIVTDDILGWINLAHPLRQGEDIDPPEWNALQIMWNFDVDPATVLEYHVFVSVDGGQFQFLGQTQSGDINYFWWTPLQLFKTEKAFVGGPEGGHTYQFHIVLRPLTGKKGTLRSGTLKYTISE